MRGVERQTGVRGVESTVIEVNCWPNVTGFDPLHYTSIAVGTWEPCCLISTGSPTGMEAPAKFIHCETFLFIYPLFNQAKSWGNKYTSYSETLTTRQTNKDIIHLKIIIANH